jgi:hypothetical protein
LPGLSPRTGRKYFDELPHGVWSSFEKRCVFAAATTTDVTPTLLWLWLWHPVAERLPSADRSQQILNTAGRHRDSAARLCSALLSDRHPFHAGNEAVMWTERSNPPTET